jgi:hypothetical protein
VLQEELDKEKEFYKGYKKMWKYGRRMRQRLNRKIKYLLKNYGMRMRSSRVT